MTNLHKNAESRPRVLHGVTSSLTLSTMRGQLSFLRNHGFSVAVFCAPGEKAEQTRSREGVEVFTPALLRRGSLTADLRGLRQLWRIMRAFRPHISNVGTPKAGLLGGLAAFAARVPCRVYLMRGLRYESESGLRRWLLWMAELLMCRLAHRVFCVSPSLRRKAISSRLVSPERSVVLHHGGSNGVDVDRFSQAPELVRAGRDIRAKLGFSTDSVVLGFVGRFTVEKGFAEMLRACTNLRGTNPHLHLLLIGDFEATNPVPDRIRETVKNEPWIVPLGNVPDTAPYYHAMDILVLPTYREGFPNVVLEAQACAVPVVTTTATGAVDSVEDGRTGILVEARNEDSLAKGIARLLNDPELRRTMGAAARARACRDFRQEDVWSALVAEYNRLLAERGLPAAVAEASPEVRACTS